MMGKMLVATRGIKTETDATPAFMQEVLTALSRFKKKDWGEMSEDDKAANDSALLHGDDRVFAAYETSKGKVYIITEYDRSATTILFAHEY